MTCQGERQSYLPEHDNPGSQSCSSIARNGEKLNELRKQILAPVSLALEFHANVGVVGISGGLEICESQALEGFERLFWSVVLYVPSMEELVRRLCQTVCRSEVLTASSYVPGAFWAEEDLSTDDEWKDDSAAEHESPAKIWGQSAECHAHDVSEHDT